MEKNHVVLDLDEYNAMRDEIKALKNSEDKRSSIADRIARAIVGSNLPDYVMDKIDSDKNTIDINYDDPIGVYVSFDKHSNLAHKVFITINLN